MRRSSTEPPLTTLSQGIRCSPESRFACCSRSSRLSCPVGSRGSDLGGHPLGYSHHVAESKLPLAIRLWRVAQFPVGIVLWREPETIGREDESLAILCLEVRGVVPEVVA